MSLRDQIAADLAVFLDAEGFGAAVTILPAGTAALAFAATVHVGDLSEEQQQTAWADNDLERFVILARSSDLRAGFLAKEGASRDLRPGDQVLFPTGHELAGAAWRVEKAQRDDTGATSATIARSAAAIGRSADAVRAP